MLTNFQLEEMAVKKSVPLNGVFSKDQLPTIPKAGGYIVNLQDSVDESGKSLPGTHWTAFYIENNKAIYFDSFGCLPPVEVESFLKPYKPYRYNRKEIQNIRGSVCGYYCFYFLWFMSRQKKSIPDLFKRFETFVNQFSINPLKNQTILETKIKPI